MSERSEFLTVRGDLPWLEGPLARIQVVRGPVDVAALETWLAARASDVLALDCETNAADPFGPDFVLRLVQIADAYLSWVLVVDELGADTVARLVRGHDRWLAHYAEADLRFLAAGAPGSLDLDPDREYPHLSDLQVVLAYYDPRTVVPHGKDGIHPRIARKRGLKDTVTRELSPALAEAEQQLHARFRALAPVGQRTPAKSRTWGFAHIPDTDETYLIYAGLDPLYTRRLWDKFWPVLAQRDQTALVIDELVLQWRIDLAMARGLEVDPEYAVWLDHELSALLDANADVLSRYGIGRSGHGAAAISAAFEGLGVTSPQRTPTGQPSFTKTVLEGLTAASDPEVAELAGAITASRKAGKFRSTYVEPLLAAARGDGRVHPSMRAVGTVTGRMSARDPAIQQIPKKDTRVRAALRAPAGHVLVSADFAQGEPRTMAGLSGDPDFTEAVLRGDINADTAEAAYGVKFDRVDGKHAGTESYLMRQRAKAALLSWTYGAGVERIASTLDVPLDDARHVLAFWRDSYPRLAQYGQELNTQTSITLASGRVCPLWDRYWIDDVDGMRTRNVASRKGLNYITQGTQRDLLCFALWRLCRFRGWSAHLWMLLHDEIILSVPDDQAEQAAVDLEWAMRQPFHGVPIEAEAEVLGRTWMPQPDDFAVVELDAVESS